MNKVSLVALLFAAAAVAQPTVLFKPVLKYGSYTVWTASVAGDPRATGPITLSHEAIMQTAPGLLDLPNDIAQDVLIAVATRKSLPAKIWAILSPTASVGTGALGIVQKKNGPLYISAGISIVDLIVQLVTSKAGNPQKYFAEMLPSSVTLGPTDGRTYGVVSVYKKGAIPIGPMAIGTKRF